MELIENKYYKTDLQQKKMPKYLKNRFFNTRKENVMNRYVKVKIRQVYCEHIFDSYPVKSGLWKPFLERQRLKIKKAR